MLVRSIFICGGHSIRSITIVGANITIALPSPLSSPFIDLLLFVFLLNYFCPPIVKLSNQYVWFSPSAKLEKMDICKILIIDSFY